MSGPAMHETIRQRRITEGLSQRELAAVSGVPQPNIAAYETGRRTPTAETLGRLNTVLNLPTLARLRGSRQQILDAAKRRGLSDVRVFGSVARGTATADSDIDLLVHPGPQTSLFDLAGFMADVSELLEFEVDVVSDRGVGHLMDRIQAEAVPL